MAVLGYLPKLKKDLGLAFGVHFLHDFPITMLFNTLLMDKISILYLFSFPIYQTKCEPVDNKLIYLGSTSKAMAADEEKKRGRQKYKNLNISKSKRAF